MGQTLNPSDLPGTVNGNDSTTEENRSDSSQSKTSSSSSSSSSSASGKVREKSLAFTVPGDEGDASLIRKHPPLRFRRLEDQQVEISQEIINNKQAEAEKRRTAVSVSSQTFLRANILLRLPQIIQERAKSARSSSARMKSLPAVKGQYQVQCERRC